MPLSSSSTIKNSLSEKPPSASSISSAVSVGAMDMSKCATPTLRTSDEIDGLRLPKKKNQPYLFKTFSVTKCCVQSISRTAVITSARNCVKELCCMPQKPRSGDHETCGQGSARIAGRGGGVTREKCLPAHMERCRERSGRPRGHKTATTQRG